MLHYLIESTRTELKTRFAGIELAFDVTVEVSGLTRADLPFNQAERIILLAGYSPFEHSSSSPAAVHSDLEQRSMRWSARLVDLIGDPDAIPDPTTSVRDDGK